MVLGGKRSHAAEAAAVAAGVLGQVAAHTHLAAGAAAAAAAHTAATCLPHLAVAAAVLQDHLCGLLHTLSPEVCSSRTDAGYRVLVLQSEGQVLLRRGRWSRCCTSI